jgi:preprotein translocase subunit Sec61beta
MVKMTHGPAVSGPSSSIGIMRFFDVDTKGPKLTPEFVVGLAIVFVVLVLAIKFFFFGS